MAIILIAKLRGKCLKISHEQLKSRILLLTLPLDDRLKLTYTTRNFAFPGGMERVSKTVMCISTKFCQVFAKTADF